MKLRIVLYCVLGGLPMAIVAAGAGHFAWWWLSGTVLAAAFVPVALFGPRGALRQFGVIAPVLAIVSLLCTWSEAVVFFPSMRQHAGRDLAGGLLMYIIIAAALAGLAPALKLAKPSDRTVEHRSPAGAIAMIVVSGIAYTLFYLVFGAITYQFFTKAYYPGADQIARDLGLWFWVIQVARGLLMTVAVLPAIYTLRLNRWQTAIAIGMIIWVGGGLAPLLMPNELMGTTQRMIHMVEILTQNAPLGIIAGLSLRPKSRATSAALPKVAAASL
jgi:hypothetical protein